MTKTFSIKILFNVGVLELGAIGISYSIDLHFKLILGSRGKLLKYFMNLALVVHKKTQVYRE
jgi:hypothetical protein